MFTKTTENITVSVRPTYLDDQSNPEDMHFVWAYQVTITNDSNEPVRLQSRYWRITDSNGHIEEVEGDGVVGEQPLLMPGESYEYTSGTPLRTPGGIMVGNYYMERQDGQKITVDIPAFSLDSPYQNAVIN